MRREISANGNLKIQNTKECHFTPKIFSPKDKRKRKWHGQHFCSLHKYDHWTPWSIPLLLVSSRLTSYLLCKMSQPYELFAQSWCIPWYSNVDHKIINTVVDVFKPYKFCGYHHRGDIFSQDVTLVFSQRLRDRLNLNATTLLAWEFDFGL
jgi:hypothetical protein